jgi:hypothetical protein
MKVGTSGDHGGISESVVKVLKLLADHCSGRWGCEGPRISSRDGGK